jgi:DNA mismatch repair protein MutS
MSKRNPMAKLIAQIENENDTSHIAEKTIYEKYLDHTKKYKDLYGAKTVILMMVGSFYELYGLKTDPSRSISDVAKLCQLNTSEKKKGIVDGHQVLMAGFPEYTLEKYIQIFSDAGYTSVVIIQDEENSKKGDKKKHMIHSIYSPGTYIPATTNDFAEKSNNIMCIWLSAYMPLHKTRANVVFGMSILNMFTGKSYLAEHMVPFENNPTTFDELERAFSIYAPCEVIFLYDLAIINSTKDEHTLLKTVKTYCGLECDCVHDIHIKTTQSALNCVKPAYITQILESNFGVESYESCEEFRRYPSATQSYCYLLNFVKEHNPSLLKKINMPEFANVNTQSILANHALKQLNIIDDFSADGIRSGKLSSVLNFVNKACTSMGKRRIKEMMTKPIYDADQLNAEYERIAEILDPINYGSVVFARKELAHVMDLEKVLRQTVVKKIAPNLIIQLYESLSHVHEITIHSVVLQNETIEKACLDVMKEINDQIDLTKICVQNEHTIFKNGVNREMDNLITEFDNIKSHIDAIQGFFNMIMRSNGPTNDDTEYVKLCGTEKSGSTLQMTKIRAKNLKILLDKGEYKIAPWFKGSADAGKGTITFRNYEIDYSDLKFKSATTSNDELSFVQLTKLCIKMFNLESAIEKKNTEMYDNFVESVLENRCFPKIESIINYIIDIDALQCRAYVAKEYKYCRPIIDPDREYSFVDAKGLRHVLIEHIQQNELYVANDLALNKGGILLYGTNAVGKTSLIRAIGIATIMAQCGFYVPCSTFRFKPYKSFFTRILGNDNLYKGLSTFGVEMSELRMILKNADENSMILGDELCSGTETQSALSIFVAGLMDLHEKKSSFIFATHFHEIVDYEEIQLLDRLFLKHMSVFYDRERDCLVYDRLLKDGSGDKMYGLEVCKSLHLPTEFLEKAFNIRAKYFPETAGDLNFNTTRYNAKKVRGLCEMCKTALSTETHHLMMQKEADEDGYVGGIHKNHKANLMALCEACHQKTHTTTTTEKVTYKTTKKIVKKKTTIGMVHYECPDV